MCLTRTRRNVSEVFDQLICENDIDGLELSGENF